MAPPDQVTELLRRDILSGKLPPGERLIELDLAERYQSGRASVRAALVTLEGERLIERRANRGAVVRRVGLAEVIQITEARSALEALVARHAARIADDAGRARLTGIIGEMHAAVAERDYAQYSRLNATLHLCLCDVSKHTVASDLVANLRNRAAHHQFRLALMPGRPEQSLPEHEEIVNAVVSGDEDAASAAMERHMASVLHVLRHWDDLQVPV